MDEAYSECTPLALMLMLFSHALYPQRKANITTAYEQYRVASGPKGPYSRETHCIKGHPDPMCLIPGWQLEQPLVTSVLGRESWDLRAGPLILRGWCWTAVKPSAFTYNFGGVLLLSRLCVPRCIFFFFFCSSHTTFVIGGMPLEYSPLPVPTYHMQAHTCCHPPDRQMGSPLVQAFEAPQPGAVPVWVRRLRWGGSRCFWHTSMPCTITCLSGALSAGNAVTWVLAASEFPRERIFFSLKRKTITQAKLMLLCFI